MRGRRPWALSYWLIRIKTRSSSVLSHCSNPALSCTRPSPGSFVPRGASGCLCGRCRSSELPASRSQPCCAGLPTTTTKHVVTSSLSSGIAPLSSSMMCFAIFRHCCVRISGKCCPPSMTVVHRTKLRRGAVWRRQLWPMHASLMNSVSTCPIVSHLIARRRAV